MTSGSDLVKIVNLWNGTGYTTYNPIDSNSRKSFSRFCSADLPAISAFFNEATGLGVTERIYMNGKKQEMKDVHLRTL